jgi:Na+-translocating ferredoxin:NAD+ oxidoreductase RNF subunit RnfB
MARREIIEVTCDRCKKIKTMPKDLVTNDNELVVTMYRFDKKKTIQVVFEDLCTSCRDTVTNYIDRALKMPAEENKLKNLSDAD